jgi:hypothetical protein
MQFVLHNVKQKTKIISKVGKKRITSKSTLTALSSGSVFIISILKIVPPLKFYNYVRRQVICNAVMGVLRLAFA